MGDGHIDLFTIYLLLACLCGTLAVAWIVLWRAFAHVPGVALWTLSICVLAVGGVMVVYRIFADGQDEALLGHLVIHVGLNLGWVGTCRFYGRREPWRAFLVLSLCGAIALWAAGDSPRNLNLVYAGSAVIPFGLTALAAAPFLLSSLAARVIVGGLALSILGQVLRIFVVLTHAWDFIPTTIERPVGMVAVIAFAFGWMASIFGYVFALMERERAVLSAMVVEDELTGLASRRFFLERLSEECARADRTGVPFCLLILDLDGFKAINDAHGHAAGDASLRRFGGIVAQWMRHGDVAARMGGDEFGVLLSSAQLAEGLRRAEELRAAVRRESVQWDGRTLPLSVSIGVAQWDPQTRTRQDDLTAEADRALYKAKQEGRDCVACISTLLPLGG